MAPDSTAVPDSSEPEVMAAVDTDSGEPRLVIADITIDGAWLSAPTGSAVSLPAWR
ncbi:hypothetical protein ACFQH6_00275 [Halobacteriaceae archaeon GCM10025711]